jgi:hypothetical protein
MSRYSKTSIHGLAIQNYGTAYDYDVMLITNIIKLRQEQKEQLCSLVEKFTVNYNFKNHNAHKVVHTNSHQMQIFIHIKDVACLLELNGMHILYQRAASCSLSLEDT